MSQEVGQIVPFVLLATGAGIVGGVLALFWAPRVYALIAEELLVESIQAEESLFSTAMLFAGFAALQALKLLGPDGS